MSKSLSSFSVVLAAVVVAVFLVAHTHADFIDVFESSCGYGRFSSYDSAAGLVQFDLPTPHSYVEPVLCTFRVRPNFSFYQLSLALSHARVEDETATLQIYSAVFAGDHLGTAAVESTSLLGTVSMQSSINFTPESFTSRSGFLIVVSIPDAWAYVGGPQPLSFAASYSALSA